MYRVPAGVTVVLRSITIVNSSSAAAGESAVRIRPLTRAGEWWIWYSATAPQGNVYIETRQELLTGEALEVVCATGWLDVAATGYVFA